MQHLIKNILNNCTKIKRDQIFNYKIKIFRAKNNYQIMIRASYKFKTKLNNKVLSKQSVNPINL